MTFSGIAVLGLLATFLGGMLGWAGRRIRPTGARLVDAIDLLLPQTQCERCGHPGCRPYAEAIAEGAAINRCPPGGSATIATLATLLNRPVTPLDAALQPMDPLAVALVDESRCIGCALCLPACPVDAIAGAAGYLHTVIARQCTGCELCIPACPVDCISMTSSDPPTSELITRAASETARPAASKRRFEAHRRRATAQARAAEERRQQRQSRMAARRWDGE
jgi:electron transport complex protein RnfB